jgi:hypothetical protein
MQKDFRRWDGFQNPQKGVPKYFGMPDCHSTCRSRGRRLTERLARVGRFLKRMKGCDRGLGICKHPRGQGGRGSGSGVMTLKLSLACHIGG